jgi:hypothetical protein
MYNIQIGESTDLVIIYVELSNVNFQVRAFALLLNKDKRPNDEVQWLEHLLYIFKVMGSNVGPKPGYSNGFHHSLRTNDGTVY